MTQEEFKKQHIKNCPKLNEAYNKKNNEKEFSYNSLLPRAETIYEKKYYFMDETL